MVKDLAGVMHVWRRPRAWLLVYALTSAPAALLASLWALVFIPMARVPLFAEAMTTQRLDFLMDFMLAPALASRSGAPVVNAGLPLVGSLIVVCGALLIWPLFGVAWVFLEGGALADYAAAEPLPWRVFGMACRRWFGPFILLNSAGVVVAGLALGVSWGVAYALRDVLPLTAQVVRMVGWLVAGAVASLVELARVVGVVHDTRHVGVMLRGAWQTWMQQPIPVLLLHLVGLALYGLLGAFYRALMDAIPFPWWPMTLLVQQLYVVLRLGVRLAREAGLVGIAG